MYKYTAVQKMLKEVSYAQQGKNTYKVILWTIITI